jgi:hypothetical protein
MTPTRFKASKNSRLDKGVMPESKSDIAWIPEKDSTLSNIRSAWTAAEDQYLADNWKTIHVTDIAKHLRRSVPGVKKRAQVLAIVEKTPGWTDHELEMLAAAYAEFGAKATAEKLATAGYIRSERAIRFQAMSMGLRLASRQPIESPKPGKRVTIIVKTNEQVKMAAQRLAIKNGVGVGKIIEQLIMDKFADETLLACI